MMEKNWKLKSPGESGVVDHLVQVLNVDRVVAFLLAQRGVSTFDEAKAFFRPSLDDLHDPFLMKDMDKAVDRLHQAIAGGEKILVYGDYDVDGTTSVALMYLFLSRLTSRLDYYIPNRYSEGYGVSYRAIDYAAEDGFNLVVALDCGIKAVEKVEYAKEKGVDFIICDHHYPGNLIPNASAVLDPKRPDCNYPYDQLSGCGVGFKFIQAYAKTWDLPFEEVVEYIDLVAVSIASDIVPITGENRVLAFHGLKKLNENPGMGLKSVIKTAGIENKVIEIDDIVFKIGPRINAAGRIESGRSAVDLLVATDEELACSMSSSIDEYNNTRKNIDSSITTEALEMIANNPGLQEKSSTVLFNPLWHKGVIGIVASRLIENYYRPTVVLTESNGWATGSARSVFGFDLYQAIDHCSDLLENFGGHMYAAGITLKVDNVPVFTERFEEYVSKHIGEDQLVPCVEIDAQIELPDITPKLMRLLKQFQPFGPENMAPVFLSKKVYDNGNGRIVGATSDHLRLEVIQENQPYLSFSAIGFGLGKHIEYIRKGLPFDICFCLDENEFRGKTTVQLRLKDIK